MKMQKFQNIPIGTKLRHNNIEYIKIETERVSCCRTHNVVMSSDPQKKTHINDFIEVEVIDE